MRSIIAALAGLALSSAALAQELAITASDSAQSVLSAQKGKRVTVRTRGSQELTGTVRDVNAKIVILGAVSGREFFDAAVQLEAIDAVLVRTKQ